MKESYELKDILYALIGRTEAAGETHLDNVTFQNLALALPQLFEVVWGIFRDADREADRHEASMKKIGMFKLNWAEDFKELFDSILPEKDDETVISS